MESFIVAALCGVMVGIFSGLLGIGGGTLMVPLFRLGFGLPAIGATATSLFTIIPTSLSGCITHLKNKTCIPKLGLATGIAGACTSAFGVYCANNSPDWVIMLAVALIIAYSSYTMFKKAIRMPKEQTPSLKKPFDGKKKRGSSKDSNMNVQVSVCDKQSVLASDEKANTSMPDAMSEAIVADAFRAPEDDRPHLTTKNLLTGSLIGLFAGFASGYVGVGGGFIMVPLFVSVLGITMKHASGTSLIAVTILAVPGAIEQGLLGNIDYVAGIAMAAGSIPGALIGASAIRFIPERKLRFVFGFFLLLSAIVLAINEFFPMAMG